MGTAKRAAEAEAERDAAVQADIAVTLGDLLKKKRVTRHHDVVIDQDAVDAYNELRGELDLLEAQSRIESSDVGPDEVAAKQAECDAAGEALFADKAVIRFTMGAIGAEEMDELINAHPPTDKQRAQGKAEGTGTPRFNMKTFAPALVHACLIAPALSLDEIRVIWKDQAWNDYELGQLFGVAWLVNQTQSPLADLGKDFGKITGTA